MKLTDVVYASFASLSYVNWDGIKSGTDIKDAMFDIKKKNANKLGTQSRHLYMVYSEDQKFETPLWDKHFDNWRYMKSGSMYAILKKYGYKSKFELTKDWGFYGIALENDTDIVVAFRGTNDIHDALVDIQLYTGGYANQITAAYLFLNSIINTNTKKRIHLVGHSLGGSLVQAMMVNKNIASKVESAVTFNPLGIKTMLQQMVETGLTSFMMMNWLGWMNIPNYGIVANEIIKYAGLDKKRREGSIMNSMLDEKSIVDIINRSAIQYANNGGFNIMFEKDSKLFKNLKYQFGTVSSEKFEDRLNEKLNSINNSNKSLDVDDVEVKAFLIYNAIKFIRDISIDRSYEDKITNYIISTDVIGTALIPYGNISIVDTSKNIIIKDNGIKNITKLDKSLIATHGIGNFVLFLNNSGMFDGSVRRAVLLSLVRDYMITHPKYKKVFVDPDIPSILRKSIDIIMNIPVEISVDNTIDKLYSFGYVYKEFMNNLILSSDKSSIEIGSFFNMKFDSINGTDSKVVVKII